MYGVRHDVYLKLAPAPLNHAGTIVTQKDNEKDSLQNPKEPNNLLVKCQVEKQRKSPEVGLKGQINITAACQIQVRRSRQKPPATRK
jgi:hypothetical protein